MRKRFIHLHVHSIHSFLDGMIRLDHAFKHAKSMGQDAMAITDHGNVSGMLSAYKHAKDAQVKYIIGTEAYITENYDKEDRRHLILLVQNDKGYQNFLRLQYESWKPEHLIRGKPTIGYDILHKYSEGLIATSACVVGAIAKYLMRDNNPEEALRHAKILKECFDGRFFIELQATGWDVQKKINTELLSIANKCNLETICSVDAHYSCHNHYESHDTLLAIQAKRAIDDPTRQLKFPCEEYYLKTEEEVLSYFSDPNIVYRTGMIADMCDEPTWLENSGYNLPTFPIEKEKDFFEFRSWLDSRDVKYKTLKAEDAFLFYRCSKNFKIICGNLSSNKEYKERLWHELQVIFKKNLSSYMLLVADYVNAARRSSECLAGPGRGSAAGSIVSYILGITEVDPIKYGLLFSRFINEERQELADIDVDFSNQAFVRNYLRNKYGDEHVALIANYSNMKPKSLIKDVARSMNLGGDKSETFKIANQITKNLPDDYSSEDQVLPVKTIDDALKASPEFAKIVEQHPKLLTYTKDLEGLYRQPGVHAAGMIISPKSLPETLPMWTSKGEWVCQFDGKTLEKHGYLKVDILKLDALNVIRDTLIDIEKITGRPFSGYNYEDKNVYKTIGDGHLLGMFQLEKSDSMQSIAMAIKPNTIEEISLIIALNRPGPMRAGMHEDYPKRKFGKVPVTYMHSKLENALKNTLGILVYEEQVQQIARDLAGFSLGEGDNIRKICKLKGKGDSDKIMAALKERFVQGCKECSSMTEEESSNMFQFIENFSGYGFNHSHSISYALLSYRTAYLKYHYPAIFLNACLNYADEEWAARYRGECKRLGIKVLTPNINDSALDYKVIDSKTISMGLASIKGLARREDKAGNLLGSAAAILQLRPFSSFEDFIAKTSGKRISSAVVAALNKAGAFDNLGTKRKDIDEHFEEARKTIQKLLKKNTYDSSYRYPFTNKDEWTDAEKLRYEASVLGDYVSGDFMALYSWFFTHNDGDKNVRIFKVLRTLPHGSEVKIEVFIKRIIRISTIKKGRNQGKKYAIFEVEDAYNEIMELWAWPEEYGKYKDKLKENSFMRATAQVSNNGSKCVLIFNGIVSDKYAKPDKPNYVYIMS